MSQTDHAAQIAQTFDLCAELSNSTFSPAARQTILSELTAYPHSAVINALHHCARQGTFTLAALLQQLDTDKIHNPDHWYAHISSAWQDESQTIIVPDNALTAADAAVLQLFRNGDHTGARQLFTQNYQQLQAKNPTTKWVISLGFDLEQRRQALQVAFDAGHINAAQMQQCLPPDPTNNNPAPPIAQHIKQLINQSKIE